MDVCQNPVTLVVENEGQNKIILKIDSSSTIDQILSSACRKWSLPKDEYCVKLAGKKLNPSWTSINADLANGTCLLVTRDSDEETSQLRIFVDVYLVDDERTLTEEFNLNGSLWDVYERIRANQNTFWKESVQLACQGHVFKEMEELKRTRLAFFGEVPQRLHLRCKRTRLPKLNKSFLDAESGITSKETKTAHVKPDSHNFTLFPQTTELNERYGRIYHSKYRNLEKISPNRGKRLKINLPNDYVVEVNFASTETVNDVIEFVAKFTTCSPDKFYLCLESPKIILPPEKKIQDVRNLQGVLSVWLMPVHSVRKSFSFNGETMKTLEGNSLRQVVSSASMDKHHLGVKRSTSQS